jgi:hypothetical protein
LAVAAVAIGQQPRDVTEVLLGEGQDLQSEHGAIVRHDASPRKRLPGSTRATDDWGSSVSDLLSTRPGGWGTFSWLTILVIDGANVMGSRPDGWWRDGPGAARRLAAGLETAELPYDGVVLVMEGAALRGRPEGHKQRLRVKHAGGSGDDVVAELASQVAAGAEVDVVTADRGLRSRVDAAGGRAFGPGWLLDQL